jgi:hypothetical protein
MPFSTVVEMWHSCIRKADDPLSSVGALCVSDGDDLPQTSITPRKVKVKDVVLGMNILARVLWKSRWGVIISAHSGNWPERARTC